MKCPSQNSITKCALALVILAIYMIAGCGDDVSGPSDGCSTSAEDPMPVPINLTNPDTAYFDESFTATWDHVWTGCGGYEFEYRRAATTNWVKTNVPSGCQLNITIPKPSPPVNNPTSYELRARSYWGSGNDVKVYSKYSQSSGIELALSCGNSCSTPAANPMPVPVNLTNPDTTYFDQSFTISWTHVWVGCGGYELEYRRAGTTTWIVTDVASGSIVNLAIPLPSPPIYNPTSYELRVRSYWGGSCDSKEYSEYSLSSNVELLIP